MRVLWVFGWYWNHLKTKGGAQKETIRINARIPLAQFWVNGQHAASPLMIAFKPLPIRSSVYIFVLKLAGIPVFRYSGIPAFTRALAVLVA
jgi:hypothetical protein